MLSMFEQPVPTTPDADNKDNSITEDNYRSKGSAISEDFTKTNSMTNKTTKDVTKTNSMTNKTTKNFTKTNSNTINDSSIPNNCSNSMNENQDQNKRRDEVAKVTGRFDHTDMEFDSVLSELQCIEGERSL